MKQGRFVVVSVCWLVVPCVAFGQATTKTEVGSDGRTYHVTENTWQQSVPYVDYETRTEKVYQPQLTSEVQTYQQTYAVPVTEYRMVSRLRGWWNPLTPPYWTHELKPVTRWDYRAASVQVPVSKTAWVEATRTVQVPVTKYRTESQTLITKAPVFGPATTNGLDSLAPQAVTPMVAARPADGRYGSEKYTSDIPRNPSLLR
jgi:hypothetical protein